MTLAKGSDRPFDLQWHSSYERFEYAANGNHDSRYHFSLHYIGTASDDPTVEDLIGSLSVDPDLPDTRATWHRNYTPLTPWVRAHVLKQAMGWNGEKQLAEHSEEHPELAVDYGFVDDSTEKGYPKPPAQSRLWEMFREEFNDELQAICRL